MLAMTRIKTSKIRIVPERIDRDPPALCFDTGCASTVSSIRPPGNRRGTAGTKKIR
jgi:hypothetical protein